MTSDGVRASRLFRSCKAASFCHGLREIGGGGVVGRHRQTLRVNVIAWSRLSAVAYFRYV